MGSARRVRRVLYLAAVTVAASGAALIAFRAPNRPTGVATLNVLRPAAQEPSRSARRLLELEAVETTTTEPAATTTTVRPAPRPTTTSTLTPEPSTLVATDPEPSAPAGDNDDACRALVHPDGQPDTRAQVKCLTDRRPQCRYQTWMSRQTAADCWAAQINVYRWNHEGMFDALYCESKGNEAARNGQYVGLLQDDGGVGDAVDDFEHAYYQKWVPAGGASPWVSTFGRYCPN